MIAAARLRLLLTLLMLCLAGCGSGTIVFTQMSCRTIMPAKNEKT